MSSAKLKTMININHISFSPLRMAAASLLALTLVSGCVSEDDYEFSADNADESASLSTLKVASYDEETKIFTASLQLAPGATQDFSTNAVFAEGDTITALVTPDVPLVQSGPTESIPPTEIITFVYQGDKEDTNFGEFISEDIPVDSTYANIRVSINEVYDSTPSYDAEGNLRGLRTDGISFTIANPALNSDHLPLM